MCVCVCVLGINVQKSCDSHQTQAAESTYPREVLFMSPSARFPARMRAHTHTHTHGDRENLLLFLTVMITRRLVTLDIYNHITCDWPNFYSKFGKPAGHNDCGR